MATKPMGEQTKAIWRQQIIALLGNFGVMTVGIAIGLPTVTLDQLTDVNETFHLNQSQASWYVSLNWLVAPLGALLCGFILDKIGRKNCLFLMSLIAIISWTIMAFVSENNNSIAYSQLLASRFLIGIVGGFGPAPMGVYSAEISLPKTRAKLVLFSSIAVAGGITLIYLIGNLIPNNFRLIGKVLICYQIIALLFIIPMPETSSWLISKGRFDEAKQSLNFFRGVDKKTTETYEEIETEFNLLQKSIQQKAGEEEIPLLKLKCQPEVFKPLLIMFGLFVCQHFTGIFIVIVYAVQITAKAGVQIDPFKCAILIGVANLITIMSLSWIYDKWGRRKAGIVSACGMAICMWILTESLYFSEINILYLPIVTLVAYIIFSTIGLSTLPYFMFSEIFPQKARGPCVGISLACGTLLGFLTTKTYPSIDNMIGTKYCFALFGLNSFLSILFVYFFLPETKGRTLLEIEEGFRGRQKD